MKRLALLPLPLLAIVASLGATGCEWVALGLALSDDDCSDCCDGDCWDDPPPPPPPDPPTVEFTIPSWPPVGPTSPITITASSDNGLSRATFSFLNAPTKSFDGGVAGSVTVTGSELGEGFGQMGVTVFSLDGSSTRRAVDGLLVDLTPPEAFFHETVLPATGKHLTFWMGDAWIVAGCEITIGDATFTAEVDPGYPDTIGVEWDFSLVTIPVEEIPIGAHQAYVSLWDAAGNTSVVTLPILIDGIAPEVGVPAPEEGAILDGLFNLTVTATDDTPLPIALEIRVGGALVATGASPQTTITLDTANFPAGPTQISAVAVDEAGNRSAPLVRNVVFGAGG